MVIQVTLLAEEWTQSAKGGALSTLNRQLGIHLAQHPDLKVSLLIPKCSPDDKQDAEKYLINVIEPEELPGYDPVYWLGHPPDGFSTDFIIGHDIKLGSQGNAIRRRVHCKWIHVVHTNAEEMGMYMNFQGAISAAQEEHENQVKLSESADMVVTIGPKLKDSLSSSLSFSGKEVYNLVPGIFDEFCNLREDVQETKTFSLLIFGRGDAKDFELKGFDVAAKAVATLNDGTYHLIVVGAPDGKQEELRAKLCSHGVSREQLRVRRFYKDREQLAKLFCEADLLLMPSGTEAFGLAALEALSADLPILVTSNSGLAEALRKVPLGSQCIVDSEADWAKNIKNLARKSLEIRQIEAKTLHEGYKKKYSWKEQCAFLVEKMVNMCPGDKRSRDSREESTGSESTVDYAGKKRPTAAKQKDSTQSPAAKRAKRKGVASRFKEKETDSTQSPAAKRAKRKGVASRFKEKETGYSEMEDECSQQPATSEASSSDIPPTGVAVQEYSNIEEYSQQLTTGGPGKSVTPPTEEAVQIKAGAPEDEELESLALRITGSWKSLGRRLGFDEARLTAFERENHTLSEQAYKMLLSWKESNGRCATFKVLYKALTHELVNRKDLAEEYCCQRK